MSVDVVRRILSDYFPGRTNRLGNRRFPILPVISGVFLQDPVAGIIHLVSLQRDSCHEFDRYQRYSKFILKSLICIWKPKASFILSSISCNIDNSIKLFSNVTSVSAI